MADKHKAWRELITDYPDMPTPKNPHYDSSNSLHRKLTETIAYQERALEFFMAQDPGAVYMYKYWRCHEFIINGELRPEGRFISMPYVFTNYDT